MKRMPVMAVAVLVGALVLGTMLSACASPEETGAGPLSWDDTLELGPPGAVLGTYEGVEAYPACGNEPIEHDGTTWYPFTPADPSVLPSMDASPVTGGGMGGGEARIVLPRLLPAVAAPGPGDDVGTLTVFEGGLAHWVSDSGTLQTWLTEQELTYSWVC